MELLSFIFIYSFLTISILGYGFLFSKKLTKYNNFELNSISIGYIGIFGIFFSIVISYLTNFIFPHNNLHNLIYIFFGLIFFFIFYKKNYKKIKLKYFLFSYLLSFFSIFYFKSHDDFSYYHLSFITNIVENKIEFGLSHFDIAFNHVSSFFYFHSLFKTIFTGDYFYQIGQLSIVIFANTIILEKIFNRNLNKFLNVTFFLNLVLLIFVNVFFYRLAEHGTDRSAQILFFLVFILIVNLFEENKFKRDNFELIIIIFSLIISIKSFYIIYSILFFIAYFKFFKFNDALKTFNVFPVSYFGILILCLIFITNIAASGCFLYPIPATCIESFFWGYGKEQVVGAMQWYEIWSKAGASPNYRVENFNEYLQKFNWVSNWIDNYFFNKFSDYFLGVVFALLVLFAFFWPKNFSFDKFKKYIPVYLILIILLIEWFLNHPALRYGGFVLVFLVTTFPFIILLGNQKFKFEKKLTSIKIIILIIFIIFSGRNINRILNEYNVYDYNFLKKPNYFIDDNFYTMQNVKNKYFKNISECSINNSLDTLKCKKIFDYNFYYKY